MFSITTEKHFTFLYACKNGQKWIKIYTVYFHLKSIGEVMLELLSKIIFFITLHQSQRYKKIKETNTISMESQLFMTLLAV